MTLLSAHKYKDWTKVYVEINGELAPKHVTKLHQHDGLKNVAYCGWRVCVRLSSMSDFEVK